MAASWQDVATQQAELIASRLRELLSSGLGLLRSELGVDLGLKPELFPSWVILLTAFVGPLIVAVLWAAACGGIFGGKKGTVRTAEESSESTKAPVNKAVKTEEQKKKHKKKPVEKKPQPNGRAVVELQEDVKVAEENLKPSPEIKTEKTKKNKKKQKTEIKQAKPISTSDGKEPDEGAWETKISNREKRQQRRKDKQTGDDSGSPGGVDPPASTPVEQPKAAATAPAAQRKSKGEPLRAKHGKGEPIISQVSASWSEAMAVNGGGWNDMAMKLPAQMSVSDGENWTTIPKAAARRNPEPPAWGQEIEGSWSSVDGRMKTDLSSVSFTALGLNTTVADPQPITDMRWDSQPRVDDEWSGLNGTSADPSSDWNAPSELWGNYEEPQLESPTPPEEPISEAIKVSDEEKEKGDPAAGGSGKSKKKKKKKKKQGEDAGATPQESGEPQKEAVVEVKKSSPPVQENVQSSKAGTPAAEVRAERPAVAPESTSKKPPTQVPQRPVEPEPATKQTSSPPASQKKSEENWESPKQVKKKKARRET